MNNKNNKMTAIAAMLLLSSPLISANNDYSEYFDYDVSGAEVEHAAPATQQYADTDNIVYEDEVSSQVVATQPTEIIYEDETTAQVVNTQQNAIIYEDVASSAANTQQAEIVYEDVPTAPVAAPSGGAGYAMYADTDASSPQSTSDYPTAPLQAAVAPPKPKVKTVSRHEVDEAIDAGRVDLAHALHQRGGDLLSPGYHGTTYLHKAAAAGKLRMVKYLIKIGANPNSKTVKNWTPLHHAARFGHEHVVSYLLSVGAEKDLKTSDGFNPAQLAMNVRAREVALLLR